MASRDYMDIARQVRTAWSLNLLRARISEYRNLSLDSYGLVLMDDVVSLNPETGTERPVAPDCAVLCFERAIYFFKIKLLPKGDSDTELSVPLLNLIEDYPVGAWDLGPAIRCITPLSLIQYLPCECIRETVCFGSSKW